MAWDCSVALFDLPACYITPRQLLQLLTGLFDVYFMFFLCLLSSYSPILPTRGETGGWSSELRLITVCGKALCGSFCCFFWCVLLSGRVHLILLISGLMSQRALYSTVLMMIVRICTYACVGLSPCEARVGRINADVCLLQEWSLLLITG